MPQAYCMKCREKRDIEDAELKTFRNGRPAYKGKCGICDTRMFTMVSKKEVEELARIS